MTHNHAPVHKETNMCKYSYTDTEANQAGYHNIICKETEDVCLFVHYCSKVNDLINNDNVDTHCKIYKNAEDKDYMKEGKYKVVRARRGDLYVQITIDDIRIIRNPFDYEPSGVDVTEIDGEYYIKGYEPKPIKKKVTEKSEEVVDETES